MDRKNLVGDRIVEARRRAKPSMKQIELVAKLQLEGIAMTQSALSKIEHGQRPVTDIEFVAICKILKVSTAWLLRE